MLNKKWKMGHIFVAFSEYLNFTVPCTRVMRINIQTQIFLFQFSKSAFISKWKILINIEKVNFRHFFPIVLFSDPAKFFSAKIWQRYFDNGRFAQNQLVLFGEIVAFLCDDLKIISTNFGKRTDEALIDLDPDAFVLHTYSVDTV